MKSLKDQVREAARIAEEQSFGEDFNAMTWLDLALEDNPESFDSFFDTPWSALSEDERQQRVIAIRRVL